MELKLTIRELESEAVKYINAANTLRALEGVPERGRLTFEAVDDATSGTGPGNTRSTRPDSGAAVDKPSATTTRRGRRPKADKQASDKETARATSRAGATDRSSRWTPERRAAQAERMRQRRRQRHQETSEPGATSDEPQTGDTNS